MLEVDCFPSHLGANCIPRHVVQVSNYKQCLVFILFLFNGDGKRSHVVTERKKPIQTQVFEARLLLTVHFDQADTFICFFTESGLLGACKCQL